MTSLADLNALALQAGGNPFQAAARAQGAQLVEDAVPDAGGLDYFFEGLDWLSRPWQIKNAAIVGALDPKISIGDAIGQAATRERDFTSLDIMSSLGFNRYDPVVKGVAFAADILDPTDPLNYIGIGYANKAARAARGVAKATKAADRTADQARVLNRVTAAEDGLWSPLNYAGKRLVPAAISKQVAKPVQAIAEKSDRFLKRNRIAKQFGGVDKFAEKFPSLDAALRGAKSDLMESEELFQTNMRGFYDELTSSVDDPKEVERILADTTALLETPQTKIDRINDELVLIDTGQWERALDPRTSGADIEEFRKYAGMSQAELDVRKQELMAEITELDEGGMSMKPPEPRTHVVDAMRDSFGLSQDEAYLTGQVMELAATTYARRYGTSPDEWWEKTINRIDSSSEVPVGALTQRGSGNEIMHYPPSKERILSLRGSEKVPKGSENKVLVKDAARYFDDHYNQERRAVPQPAGTKKGEDVSVDPTAAAMAERRMMDELADQLKQKITGIGWYDGDVEKAMKIARRLYPELKKDPFREALFTSILGPTSNGQKPDQEWNIATAIYEHYRNHERLPTRKATKEITKGYYLQGRVAISEHVEWIQRMIDALKEDGFTEWMFTKHTGREIRGYRPQASWMKMNEMYYGADALGPKIGTFTRQLEKVGVGDVTIDLWVSRTFNRYWGTLSDKSADGGVREAPRNEAEREFMKTVIRNVADRMDLKPHDVQAAMWFYEKRLWGKLGIDEDLGTLSTAARNHMKRVKGGDVPLEKLQREFETSIPQLRKAMLEGRPTPKGVNDELRTLSISTKPGDAGVTGVDVDLDDLYTQHYNKFKAMATEDLTQIHMLKRYGVNHSVSIAERGTWDGTEPLLQVTLQGVDDDELKAIGAILGESVDQAAVAWHTPALMRVDKIKKKQGVDFERFQKGNQAAMVTGIRLRKKSGEQFSDGDLEHLQFFLDPNKDPDAAYKLQTFNHRGEVRSLNYSVFNKDASTRVPDPAFAREVRKAAKKAGLDVHADLVLQEGGIFSRGDYASLVEAGSGKLKARRAAFLGDDINEPIMVEGRARPSKETVGIPEGGGGTGGGRLSVPSAMATGGRSGPAYDLLSRTESQRLLDDPSQIGVDLDPAIASSRERMLTALEPENVGMYREFLRAPQSPLTQGRDLKVNKNTGKTEHPDRWRGRFFETAPDGVVRAFADFADDGSAIISAVRDTDFESGMHEFTHVLRRQMRGEDANIAARFSGALREDGVIEWTRDAEEKFVEGYMTYLREGPSRSKLPEPIQALFRRVKEMMLKTFEGFRGTVLWDDIGEDMRGVYDRLLVDDDMIDMMARKQDELHILESVQGWRKGDNPPPEFMLRRREELVKQLDSVRRLGVDASPESVDMERDLRPIVDEIRKEYLEVFRQYDDKADFPVDAYMKHMFPAHASKVSRKGTREQKKAAETIAERERELRVKYASMGYNDDSIEAAVQQELRKERGVAFVRGVDDQTLAGDLEAFSRRKYDISIREANELYDSGELPFRFEDNAIVILDAMHRDMQRFKFGHRINSWMLDNGHLVTGDAYRAMGKAEQARFKKHQFHIPFIDPKKNPFADVYIDREAEQLMLRNRAVMGAVSNGDEYSGLLQAMHGFRRWWSAWTLAPFPAFHARNFISDMVLARLGGLSPTQDLLAATKGQSAYMAGLAAASRNVGVPFTDKQWRLAQSNLQRVVDEVNGFFPDQNMDVDKLMRLLEDEQIINTPNYRDLDLFQVRDKALVDEIAKARKGRSRASKAADWLPFMPVQRSKVIEKGFKFGQHMQDVTRSSLFFHALREGMAQSPDFNAAATYAVSEVRKHLFDYSDLTSFERDVMRLIIPFYTFSAKNIPLQVEKAITDYGRQAWINRMFQGAWNGPEDDEIQFEDMPDWMQESVGLPMRKSKDVDGNETYSVFTLRGWLPQTELNEVAEAIRKDSGLSFVSARMNPIFKEFFEQTMNYDSFLGRQIDRGQTVEMYGFEMTPRFQHLVRNLRLFNEFDKLNPGGAWTKIWEVRGKAEPGAGRPHRREAPQMERWLKQLTGLNFYDISAEEEVRRKALTHRRDANKLKSDARIAAKYGQRSEAEDLLEQAKSELEEARIAIQRLNQLRGSRARAINARSTP